VHPKSSDAAEAVWRLKPGSGVGEREGGGEFSIMIEVLWGGWREGLVGECEKRRKGRGKRKGARLSQAGTGTNPEKCHENPTVSYTPVIS